MLPDPLHPAIVHLPIALAMLLPLFVVGSMVVIRRGFDPRRAWSLVVALLFVLAGSSIVAVETGQDEEEVVEEVVDHDIIHEHEERAELFRNLAVLTVVISVVGLVRGKVGSFARGAGSGMVFVLAVLAFGVGETGGDLVYVHGAASAYIDSVPTGMTEGHVDGTDDD